MKLKPLRSAKQNRSIKKISRKGLTSQVINDGVPINTKPYPQLNIMAKKISMENLASLGNKKRVDQIKKIIYKFGKPGTSYMSRALLKEKRFQNVTAVCEPQYFTGSMFMERESQMRLLDGFLFEPKNGKGKRNLITAVASSGMGKSAFTDEYCRRTAENELSCILPIVISYNTLVFGPHLGNNITVSIDLAARLIMSYFLANPSQYLLASISTLLQKKAKNFDSTENVLEAVIACIKEDLRVQSGAKKSKLLIACDEVGKSQDEKQVVQLLTLLVDNDDELECFFTGLSLNPFLNESSSGRVLNYVPLPLLSIPSSMGLVQSFIKGSLSVKKVSSKLARLSGGHPRTIQLFKTVISSNMWCTMDYWSGSMFQTVVDSTLAFQSRSLSEPEIMLLLRPRTSIDDIKENAVLRRALEEGNREEIRGAIHFAHVAAERADF
eukprot:gene23162-30016_t